MFVCVCVWYYLILCTKDYCLLDKKCHNVIIMHINEGVTWCLESKRMDRVYWLSITCTLAKPQGEHVDPSEVECQTHHEVGGVSQVGQWEVVATHSCIS